MKHTPRSTFSLRSKGLVASLLLASTLATTNVMANLAYDEGVSGDLSNSQNAPDPVSFVVGNNLVYGTTGNAASVIDRDFFTFVVPAGAQLVAIEVLDGTTSAGGGNRSFIGLISGATFGASIPSGVAGAATLLGYHHYDPSEIGTDILDNIAVGNISAPPIGFTPPLPAGTYSVWIQETAPNSSVAYGFNFKLVPDSGLGIWAGLGALGMAFLKARRTR